MKPLNRTETEIARQLAAEFERITTGLEPDFSDIYKERRGQLITGQQKSRPKRAAVVTAVLILFIGLAACTAPVRAFLMEVYDTFTSYFATGPAYAISDLIIEIPDLSSDYDSVDKVVQEQLYIAVYRGKGSEAGELKITIDSSEERRSNLNNETISGGQEINLDGSACILLRHMETGEACVLYDAEYAVVEVYSTLSDDELLELVQGIKITIRE